eukprot:1692976-Heterocapsa_arctica.AAC.1
MTSRGKQIRLRSYNMHLTRFLSPVALLVVDHAGRSGSGSSSSSSCSGGTALPKCVDVALEPAD